MKVTDQLLATAGPKGKYLVARLTVDHVQTNCATVPAGTVGMVEGVVLRGPQSGKTLFVYPHPKGTKAKDKAFSNGELRMVPFANLTPLGRVG